MTFLSKKRSDHFQSVEISQPGIEAAASFPPHMSQFSKCATQKHRYGIHLYSRVRTLRSLTSALLSLDSGACSAITAVDWREECEPDAQTEAGHDAMRGPGLMFN